MACGQDDRDIRVVVEMGQIKNLQTKKIKKFSPFEFGFSSTFSFPF